MPTWANLQKGEQTPRNCAPIGVKDAGLAVIPQLCFETPVVRD